MACTLDGTFLYSSLILWLALNSLARSKVFFKQPYSRKYNKQGFCPIFTAVTSYCVIGNIQETFTFCNQDISVGYPLMKKSLALFVLIILSTTHLSAQDWNLIWSDEFEGTTLNASNWTYDTGTGSAQGLTGWGNNELQYYRNGTSNIDVSGGVLSIIAKEESFGGSDYTSARIKSAGLQAWNQGKIEARIKLPIGQGIWPAFWMSGRSI